MDIPKNRPINNALVQSKRVTKKRFIGIEKIKYFGKRIQIYDAERSLCDAYRVDRSALFFKALKRYLKMHKPQSYSTGNR